jgi:hypothetical protein
LILLVAVVVFVGIVATASCGPNLTMLMYSNAGYDDAGSREVPSLVGMMGTVADLAEALVRAEAVHDGTWRRLSIAGHLRHAVDHTAQRTDQGEAAR